MIIYCNEEFKAEFQKLSKKNSYSDLETELITYFFNTEQDFRAGVNLNQNSERPFIKKRLGGRGGYRTYYYFFVKDACIYLGFVHPKAGSMGYESIGDDKKVEIMRKIVESIKTKSLYELRVLNHALTFTKI